MARRREVGIIKSCVLGAALAAGLATAAQAGDNKLALSATTAFTTDYMFRGTSLSSNGPAVQPEFDLTYGMFYAGMWGSNINPGGDGIEIDYYAGITPKWNWNGSAVTFNIAGLAYTYPGTNDLDYFELKTGATWAGGPWSIGVTNYWSPDNFQCWAPVQRDRRTGWGTHSPASSLTSSRPPSAALVGYQAVRTDGHSPRLHLLERWPDARLHGALVCRRPLLGHELQRDELLH